jgi:DnaJ-class molecular chaperone
MLRIIIFILFLGILLFLGKQVFNSMNTKKCQNCKGEGYWIGTRGDRNNCKVCGGTGQQ